MCWSCVVCGQEPATTAASRPADIKYSGDRLRECSRRDTLLAWMCYLPKVTHKVGIGTLLFITLVSLLLILKCLNLSLVLKGNWDEHKVWKAIILDYDILRYKHITFKYSSFFFASAAKNRSNRHRFVYKPQKIRAVCIHSGVKNKKVFSARHV